jgi:Dehydrogenases with different specificities (related to short-chain alcohol dehydrogenases)
MTATVSRSPLNGKIALVTGASRGLGRAIALALARAGARVAVNYCRSHEAAAAVVQAIREEGGTALPVPADVCDPASLDAMLDQIRHTWGEVEVLVHNATGPQPMKPFEEYSWEDFQQQLDFFVKAPVILTRKVLPSMKAARAGRIINIGSEVVNLGSANFSAYVAAKAAMVGLTRSWAREFGPWNITVNCVEPGWIPVERHQGVPAAELDAYTQNVPLRRQGVPDDVGGMVVFLAGDGGNFLSGQCIAVNGGNTF